MALSKPNEYKEVSARQSEETVYAEDINQIISNIEKIKGGQANEAPVATIKDIHERLLALESGSVIKPPSDTGETFEEEVYSFEKTTITLNNGESDIEINSNCFGDLSQVKLIKKSDGSLYLLGTIELISSAEASVIRVNKTLNIDARKLVGLIMNQTTGTQYFSVYQNNYLYICFILGKNQSANINISSDKIYNPNVICPYDIGYANSVRYNMSEDFGIHLIGGKYILKGSITPPNTTVNFYVNCNIEDFFENGKGYEYSGYTIQTVNQRPLYAYIAINGLIANKENIIYFECPKQPAI
ncbi:hypothetical protein [Brachyspira murdochii]|uniref:Hvp 101 VSH-1 tail protein n=1 Tax=Brachyspira murdochii (strain ATCC 51284 / DSM 12563 / 56-150) TaxID=526224 RepID=D5U4S2_BRAM5|nr:hypothetical protein [Brachyspira murdochii]ADG72326.1 hypothetical protein Bmur_2252 [Brachyspira murdochii DSM 12563]